jgi:hypothetical protein
VKSAISSWPITAPSWVTVPSLEISMGRVPVGGHQRAVGGQLEIPVARVQGAARRLNGEEPTAGKSHIERIAGWLHQTLREIGPLLLDDRHGGGGIVAAGFGRHIQAVEFAIGLVSAGGRIGHVVGEEVQRFHAGSHAAGGQCREWIHGNGRQACGVPCGENGRNTQNRRFAGDKEG